MILTILAFIGIFIVTLFLYSFLSIVIGWVIGWTASIICGEMLCAGFALLGIIITPTQLPLIAATLCWIGAFFKTTLTYPNKNKNE